MLMSSVVPAAAASAEVHESRTTTLTPEERTVIAHAGQRRRQQFMTARWCAEQAFADLGLPRPPLLPGLKGAPTWPSEFCGSITHCDGYTAAAVAHTRDITRIGIDAEPAAPLPDGLLDLVSCPSEAERLNDLSRSIPHIPWARLLFSAKEALYKAWPPHASNPRPSFLDADLYLDTDGTFTATILLTPTLQTPSDPRTSCNAKKLPTHMKGRWAASDTHVVTCACIAAGDTIFTH